MVKRCKHACCVKNFYFYCEAFLLYPLIKGDLHNPVDTGRLMYVQFTPCVYWETLTKKEPFYGQTPNSKVLFR